MTSISEYTSDMSVLVDHLQTLCQSQGGSDVLSEFYSRGLFHILEKIFLQLDPDSKAACSRVSRSWKSIVNFFFLSANPRYQVLSPALKKKNNVLHLAKSDEGLLACVRNVSVTK
jgi:hypothetical protein